jgi:hypothetical protein
MYLNSLHGAVATITPGPTHWHPGRQPGSCEALGFKFSLYMNL